LLGVNITLLHILTFNSRSLSTHSSCILFSQAGYVRACRPLWHSRFWFLQDRYLHLVVGVHVWLSEAHLWMRLFAGCEHVFSFILIPIPDFVFVVLLSLFLVDVI
jgi:hypothetical protein